MGLKLSHPLVGCKILVDLFTVSVEQTPDSEVEPEGQTLSDTVVL
jgi:hypothetical protein